MQEKKVDYKRLLKVCSISYSVTMLALTALIGFTVIAISDSSTLYINILLRLNLLLASLIPLYFWWVIVLYYIDSQIPVKK